MSFGFRVERVGRLGDCADLRRRSRSGLDPAAARPARRACAHARRSSRSRRARPPAPELIARMADEGHTVGLHCDEHVRHSAREHRVGTARHSGALACATLGVRPDAVAHAVGRPRAVVGAGRAEQNGCSSSAGPSTPTTGAATRREMLAATRDGLAPARSCSPTTASAPGARPTPRRRSPTSSSSLRTPAPRPRAGGTGVERASARAAEVAGTSTRRSSDRRRRRRATRRRVARFPETRIAALERAGALAWNAAAGERRPPAGGRARARAAAWPAPTARSDGSSTATSTPSSGSPSRRPPELRDRELARGRAPASCAPACGAAIPRPGEGPPAARRRASPAARCCAASRRSARAPAGLHRALVLARDPDGGPPLAVWIDLTDERARRGRRDLVSRPRAARVGLAPRRVPRRAGARPVRRRRARLAAQPWFARDALRTAAHLGRDGRHRGRRRAGRARRRARPRRRSRRSPPAGS